jgi:8-oxo-dGTP pyrophosphatase MutT (NUDIX family)
MNFPLALVSLSRKILDSENPLSRFNQLGHITASGLVIKDAKALLIFHPYITQWFQPGGHIDDCELPIEAAIREVYEETGILCEPTDGRLDPIDIDLHEIPANPKKGEGAHLHIDCLFLLQVIEDRESPEDIQKAWVPFKEIASPRIQRALQKIQDQA